MEKELGKAPFDGFNTDGTFDIGTHKIVIASTVNIKGASASADPLNGLPGSWSK